MVEGVVAQVEQARGLGGSVRAAKLNAASVVHLGPVLYATDRPHVRRLRDRVRDVEADQVRDPDGVGTGRVPHREELYDRDGVPRGVYVGGDVHARDRADGADATG